MAETQPEGTMIPEPYGRHALIETNVVEPVVQRPLVRGRHRMQQPPREGIPFLTTVLTLGVLGSAATSGPMQGEMRIKMVPPHEQDAGPQGSLSPVIMDDDPNPVDHMPLLRRTTQFDVDVAVKDALKT